MLTTRPLTATTFWLDWHLWRDWTLPYHIENVLLENVSIAAEQGGLEVRHVKGVTFKNVKITTKKGEPFLVKDAEISGLEAGTK